MEVILLEKVTTLGDLGDVVKVKSGYGRNFLLPQGKALTANEGNKKVFEQRKAELLKKSQESLKAAKMRAEAIAGKRVTVKGIDVPKSMEHVVEGAISQVGTFSDAIRVHTEVETIMNVIVEEEKA